MWQRNTNTKRARKAQPGTAQGARVTPWPSLEARADIARETWSPTRVVLVAPDERTSGDKLSARDFLRDQPEFLLVTSTHDAVHGARCVLQLRPQVAVFAWDEAAATCLRAIREQCPDPWARAGLLVLVERGDTQAYADALSAGADMVRFCGEGEAGILNAVKTLASTRGATACSR